ncbi:hypothetical protein DDE82_007667 [Stemphylium lycopersici]|nr:hypothetical protein DDE82_007667 [Stemphylium lycopersici]
MPWWTLQPRRGHTIRGILSSGSYHDDDNDYCNNYENYSHGIRAPDYYRYDSAPTRAKPATQRYIYGPTFEYDGYRNSRGVREHIYHHAGSGRQMRRYEVEDEDYDAGRRRSRGSRRSRRSEGCW